MPDSTSPPTFRIRPYRPADHDAITDLNRYGLAAAGVPPDADVYAGDLADMATTYLSERATMLVGELNEDVVAMGGFRPIDEDTCDILRMRVHPNHQGRGYGRQLLTALEEHARSFGYRRAQLLTGPDQHPAIDLYRAAGYLEHHRDTFGDLHGVYLSKDLT